MIRSFRDRDTQRIARGEFSRRLPPDLRRRARGCLELLAAAEKLEDLLMWPSLRLKKLRGNRAGQYSIRVNRQFRICLTWKSGDAENVELTDYH